MIVFAVSEKKNKQLYKRMEELDIFEEDIDEKFIRASGKGGQKLNKTSSSVYLKHIPTGIEVKYMKERSQSVNRFLARRELVEKIEASRGIKTDKDKKLDKIKKQKSRRKKKAKAKYEESGADCKVSNFKEGEE